MRYFYCIAVNAAVNAEILHSLRSFRMTGKMQVTGKIMVKVEILCFVLNRTKPKSTLLRQRLFASLRVTGKISE